MQLSIVLALSCTSAVLSGQRVIQTVYGTVPGGELGRVVRAVGDVDGDGVWDFVISQPETQTALAGRAFLVSGRTRGTLATFIGAPVGTNRGFGYQDVSPVGDVNGDGRTDFAIGYGGGNGPLDIFSGMTGARLYRLGATPPDWFPYACTVGDHDGDLRDDFVALAHLGSNFQLWIVRGLTGTQLGVLDANAMGPGPLRALGDVTGNGRTEVAHMDTTWVRIYQLNPPALLRTIPRPAGAGPLRRMEAADLTGDGINEILIGDDARVFALSAATGALVRTFEAPGGGFTNGSFTVVGDLDADNVPDLALVNSAGFGEIVFLSGSGGHRLAVWSGSHQFSHGSGPLAGLGDVNGDGVGDLVMGGASMGVNAAGGWQVLSCRILASMESHPTNCGGGPFLPELGMTRPILGQSVTIVGRDCPPGTVGILALSLPPRFPINLGVVGCDAWFDVSSWSILHRPPPGPTWSLTATLPNVPQLAGLEIALQAFYLPTNGPLGYDLSNGIWARIGY